VIATGPNDNHTYDTDRWRMHVDCTRSNDRNMAYRVTRETQSWTDSRYRLQNIFLGHPGTGDHVTVILQDIVHEDVERVLEFVYTGAAVVPGHRMDGFVTAAGALGIGPLLDPRRHLEMSTVRTHPCYPAPAAAAAVYEPSRTAVHQRPSCRAHRQPPRTTGILTPSPWAQNSRPPCAAPKYSAPRTVQDSAPMAAAEPTSITTVVKVSAVRFICPSSPPRRRAIYPYGNGQPMVLTAATIILR